MTRTAYRQEFPWPVILAHWAFLVCLVVQAVTGFYIHSPFWFFGATMGQMLYVHDVFMYAILVVLLVRIYWAFFGRGSAVLPDTRAIDRDYRNFGPQAVNQGTLIPVASYLLFLRRTRPRTAKYNGWEKGAYVAWALLLLASAYTGFAIYGPTYSWPVFAVGTRLLGGLGPMRGVHYLLMWAFVAWAIVHTYLALAEDLPAARLILVGRETVPEPGSDPDAV